MKLVYIHQYFTFPNNAGGTRSYDLSKEFASKGINVTIITSSAKIKGVEFKKKWSYIEREGIKFWILKCDYSHKMSIFKRIISFSKFAFFSTIKISKLKCNIVLVTSTPLTIVIPAIIKKWISTTPYIFEVRDVWPEGPIQQGYVKNKLLIKILRKIEKYIYKNADYVVPLSIGMKHDILTRVSGINMEVIPNISEIDRFENIDNKINLNIDLKNKKIILYAGTLGPVNDIIYVAKLAERTYLIDPSIIFLIIGDGKQKDKIINYCKKNEIYNKNIYFFDPVPKESLPYIYSLVTMGSSFVWDYKIKWDNSANKVFDTLAAGKPLLINYQGWQAEMIHERKCGFVLSPKPTNQEILDFVSYLNDKNRIIEHGKNAKRTAKEFSLPIAVKKYLKIFDILINTKS